MHNNCHVHFADLWLYPGVSATAPVYLLSFFHACIVHTFFHFVRLYIYGHGFAHLLAHFLGCPPQFNKQHDVCDVHSDGLHCLYVDAWVLKQRLECLIVWSVLRRHTSQYASASFIYMELVDSKFAIVWHKLVPFAMCLAIFISCAVGSINTHNRGHVCPDRPKIQHLLYIMHADAPVLCNDCAVLHLDYAFFHSLSPYNAVSSTNMTLLCQ